MSDLRPVLWLKGDIVEAGRFYEATFPDSRIVSIEDAPGDYPGGRKGTPVTVDMKIAGHDVMLLASGAHFDPTPATSLMVVTEDQAQTDTVWDAILAAGGQPMACGWISDPYGFAWQITPRRLLELLRDADRAEAAFAAMQDMIKIDIAALEKAVSVD